MPALRPSCPLTLPPEWPPLPALDAGGLVGRHPEMPRGLSAEESWVMGLSLSGAGLLAGGFRWVWVMRLGYGFDRFEIGFG